VIKIKKTKIAFEDEPFLAPFGFKGGYLNGSRQTVALLESENGKQGLGLGTQSTLWSDAEIFMKNSEKTGNDLMYRITEEALRLAKEIPFETPVDLLEKLVPLAWEYGKKITGKKNMRLTFALNALVAADNAAWQLYCAENRITDFDRMVPPELKSGLPARHREVASIPLMSYGVPLKDIAAACDDGYFFLKIKIGSDPDKDGDREKMVCWDKERLSAVHAAVKDREIPYTKDGRIPYYLDANGRYDSKERLMQLLEHAEKIGALDRILIMEEPFPEEYKVDVRDIPVRLAADESAHSDKDALERMEMGYGAIALKPIAKTMSMSLKIAKIAAEKNIPCFCADLTVNPILMDWNKNVAARLAPLPGLKIGLLETNGHQNYRNWEAMRSYHPRYGASWTKTVGGLFHLDDDFYASGAGILETSGHYLRLVS
jgi:hypothetical protein